VANDTNAKLSKHDKQSRERILKLIQMDDFPQPWIQLIDGMLRIGRRRVSESETSRLYCSAEWHFARFQGGTYAGLIYSLALRVADKSGKCFVSIPELTKYFNADDKAIREAIQLLVLSGFFVAVSAAPGRSVEYRPVPHSEWAAAHPGYCIHKDELPWSDGDQLGRALWAISGGQYRFEVNFLKGLRKTGHSDDAIAEHFRIFWPKHDPKEKHVTKFFLEYLRSQKPVVSGAENREG
jgi:hypothetical protein